MDERLAITAGPAEDPDGVAGEMMDRPRKSLLLDEGAVCVGRGHPFGGRPPISGQQPQADAVAMEGGAGVIIHMLDAHVDELARGEPAEGASQPGDVVEQQILYGAGRPCGFNRDFNAAGI